MKRIVFTIMMFYVSICFAIDISRKHDGTWVITTAYGNHTVTPKDLEVKEIKSITCSPQGPDMPFQIDNSVYQTFHAKTDIGQIDFEINETTGQISIGDDYYTSYLMSFSM